MTQFAHGFGRLRELSSGVGLAELVGVPCFLRRGDRPEFLVCGRPAGDIAPRLARAARVHDVSFFPAGDETLVRGWKTTGYRQRYTEFLMQRQLTGELRSRGPWRVRRAQTVRHLDAMSAAKRWGRAYPAGLLNDDDVHVLYVDDAGQVVGGGVLVLLRRLRAAYVEDMFTVRNRQRMGIGSAVMRRMLAISGDSNMSCCTLVSLARAKAFYDVVGLETLSELRLLIKR